MTVPLLVCTDLDRTLLPNGTEPESPGVRDTLARLVSREEVDLGFVSGRDLRLVLEAMETWRLPRPRFIVGDVGTTIYESVSGDWLPSAGWREKILRDWEGTAPHRFTDALEGIDGLALQGSDRQGPAKISYYTAADADRPALQARIEERLTSLQVRYRLVWSVDEVLRQGLVDILPASANKLHAIEYMIDTWRYAPERTVFAGDSGNDLEVLESSLRSVLVANAEEDVRRQAVDGAARRGSGDALYLARGGFLGANGNYAAGILEGIAHFFPETIRWMHD